MENNLTHFKSLLEAEKSRLEEELATVGRKNPSVKGDWEAVESDLNDGVAEEGDLAEGMEEYENNRAILDKLEKELNDVLSALEKIDSGKYGKCEVCENEIEEDRLLAMPSAKTCKTHMND